VPNQGGVLNVFGYRAARDTTTQNDPLDILVGYEEAAYEYAAYKAFRQDQNDRWEQPKAAYEAIVSDATNNTGWYTDQPTAVTTGQAQWPPWAMGGSDY
jgi:hypothetical protein